MASPVWAATYYADAAQSGSGHAGTEIDAYSEADMHNSALVWDPGDTIYCKGSFGDIDIANQAYGTVGGGWVTWAVWPGFVPDCNDIDVGAGTLYLKLDGWKIDKGWSDSGGQNTIVFAGDCSYLWFHDCTIKGVRRINPGSGDYYPYTGATTANYTVLMNQGGTTPDYITFDGCDFSYGTSGLYLSRDSTGLLIKGCDFHRYGNDSITWGSAYGAPDGVIQDCNFYDQHQWYTSYAYPGYATGAWSGHEYETITHSSGVSGIYWRMHTDTNWIYFFADDAANLPTALETDHTVFTLDSDPNITFTYDSSYGAIQQAHVDCISFEAVSAPQTGGNCTIERCAFWDSSNGFIKSTGTIATAFTLRNSWMAFDGPGGQPMNLGGGVITMYGNTSYIIPPMTTSAIRINNGVASITAYNNIFSGTAIWSDVPDANLGHNVWIASMDNVDVDARGSGDIYGQLPVNLFTDANNRDFTLVPGCTARDFGDANYTDGVDYTNTARTAIPDAGAYEDFSEPNVANNAPALDVIPPQAVLENGVLTFDVNATDTDGDPLTYYSSSPVGATFTSPTFAWQPSYRQSGVYVITISVTDGEDWDYKNVTITVTNVPQYLIVR